MTDRYNHKTKTLIVLTMTDPDMEASKSKWLKEEEDIKAKIIEHQAPLNQEEPLVLSYPLKVGGADLSFIPGENDQAICCYTVLLYQDESVINPKILWQECEKVHLGKKYLASCTVECYPDVFTAKQNDDRQDDFASF